MPGHGLRVDGEHHRRGVALPVVLGEVVDAWSSSESSLKYGLVAATSSSS